MPDEKKIKEAAGITGSMSLREDMRRLRENRHNPFLRDGKVDIDAYIEFLNDYNAFINHTPRPFKPIKDGIMKL